MGKAPAFQFYVKDWLSDPELQCVSASSRGIWIDALCYMWEAPERGKLVGTQEELSKLLRATNGDFDQFMKDLKRHKFADFTVTVTNGINEVTLINRRMIREQKDKENHALRQQRYRDKQKSDEKVTPPSSSSSSSSKKKKIYKRKVSIPDEEWVKELQAMECYSHLVLKDQLQKCVAWFKAKGIMVNRQRFLNWLNNPKFNAKPLQVQKEEKEKQIPARIMLDGKVHEKRNGEWVPI